MTRVEILAAVPTLFGADGRLDEAENRRLHEELHGVLDGVFVAGTTGEFPALSDDERMALFTTALDVWGTEPVVAHVGSPATSHAVGLTRAAVALGVQRLAALPPYYFAVDADDVRAHFAALVAAAGDVPVYAYLFPERTGVDIDATLLAGLVTDVGVAGAKVSGSAADRVPEFLAALPPGTPIWSGADADVARVHRAGARGMVSGMSAALPHTFVALAEAADRGDTAGVEAAQARVDEVVAALRSSPAGIKAALARRGYTATASRMAQGTGGRPEPAAVAAVVDATAAAQRGR